MGRRLAATAAFAHRGEPGTLGQRPNGANRRLRRCFHGASARGARRGKGGFAVFRILGAAQRFNDRRQGFDVDEMFVEVPVVESQGRGGRQGGERLQRRQTQVWTTVLIQNLKEVCNVKK